MKKKWEQKKRGYAQIVEKWCEHLIVNGRSMASSVLFGYFRFDTVKLRRNMHLGKLSGP